MSYLVLFVVYLIVQFRDYLFRRFLVESGLLDFLVGGLLFDGFGLADMHGLAESRDEDFLGG
jgi:hypothetical protein